LNEKHFRRQKLMSRRRYLVIVGAVAAAVLVAVLWQTVLANHRPAIAGLEAPEMITPSGRCEIVCIASDRDGDALSYNWSTSGGNTSGIGAAVNWTAPDSLGAYNVTVTVTDGRGEEATKQVTIEVRANRAPTITGLVSAADWTLPSGNVQVACTASDPDGDDLTYEWTATAGDISGTGAAVNWTAPEAPGVYNITAVVKDGHASQDTMFVPLSVNLATPPIIENLVVTPKGHIYLRDCTVAGCDYDVWKTREYDIECVASGTGEVVCDWSCTDGQIAGEGSAITWTAPSKTLVKATVTVILSDAAGNSVAKNIVFHVPSCTCGSW
jgi:hypothetical protein